MPKFGVRSRLVISYTLIISFVIAILSYLFYQQMSVTIWERSLETSNQMLQRVATSLNQTMRDLNQISAQVIYNSDFQTRFEDAFSNSESFEALAQKKRFENILSTLNGPSFIAEQINVFNMNGDFISYGLKIDPSDRRKELMNEIDWIPLTIKKEGDLQLNPPHRDKWFKSGELVFSLSRLFPNNAAFAPRIVEVQQRYDKLEEIIGDAGKQSNLSLFIFDDLGNRFYPVRLNERELPVDWKDIPMMPSDLFHSMTKAYRGQNFMIGWLRSSVYGLTVISVQPESVLLSPIQSLRNAVLTVSVLAEIAALLSAYLIASTITRPIRLIHHYVKMWDIDQLNVMRRGPSSRAYRSASYEIRELYDDFVSMKTRLHQSVEQLLEARQRENMAQMRVLQTQLQPHFVFNTLSSIGIIAENSGAEVAASMCYKMMGMMEYMSRTQSEFTNLSDELGFTVQYLDLMKLRYQNQFVYEVDFDETVRGFRIPKFVLQPIVENSFAHGFKEIYPPWHISIRISRESETLWDIYIRDNGSGFTPEALDRIQEFISCLDSAPASATDQVGLKGIGGLGLVNALMRLYLFQKGDVSFSLRNLNEGMELMIRMGRREELKDV